MMLLTLDLATKIGFSFGEPEDKAFSSGVHRLPSTGEDIAAFIQAFDDWLSERLCDVTLCVFEQPILPKITQLIILRKLYGQSAHLLWRCSQSGIRCEGVNVQTIKSFMGIRRNRGIDQKAEMIAAVRRYGYDVLSDDEADAIALRLWALHTMFPATRCSFSLDLGELGARSYYS
jgi:hypothetical protein